jgi:hypothetical protein
MIRNLIAHCYPRRSGKWRRTVAHLTAGARWSQFTGRKIITIAHDSCCDWPGDVALAFREALGGDPGIEWIVRPNDPELQEVPGFVPMLEKIESTNPDECTTYLHFKGATQPRGHGSHGWLDFLAAANLDYPELVACALERGNICGAFRSQGLWSFPDYHNWHFAGTWFTFRHSRIFGGEIGWRDVHPNFMGVEAWPGLVPFEESVCLFFDNANTAHLYSTEFQRRNIAPAMEHWEAALRGCGLTPLYEQSAPLGAAAATVDS